jgi:CheY-like chemotaxis protein
MNFPTKRLRILVIEDEALVAIYLEDLLIDMGLDVGAVASRMKDALDTAQNGIIDWAILDVNLDGQTTYQVADI